MVVAQRGVIPPPKHYADSAWFKYILSCWAATTAEMVTYPLDLTKTRLQIQGEKGLNGGKDVPYRGLARTGVGIVQEEGLLKLWQGVTPAVYRHFIYSGTRMVLYEKMRDHLFVTRPDGTRPVWQAIVGGILAGGIAQFLASPADLIKVQMQMEGRRILEGKAPRIHSASEAFVKIYNAGGLRGLWKGCMPNVYRSAVVNLGDLTTYDSVKRYFTGTWGMADSYWTHALSSACSGFIGAALGTPLDVVKTRVMNQPTDVRASAKMSKRAADTPMYNNEKKRRKHLTLPINQKVESLQKVCLHSDIRKTPKSEKQSTPRISDKGLVTYSTRRRGLLYKNSLDCLMQTVRNEGFWALYKGFIPCWLRMGPWSLTFWITYEQIRNACGTSAF